MHTVHLQYSLLYQITVNCINDDAPLFWSNSELPSITHLQSLRNISRKCRQLVRHWHVETPTAQHYDLSVSYLLFLAKRLYCYYHPQMQLWLYVWSIWYARLSVCMCVCPACAPSFEALTQKRLFCYACKSSVRMPRLSGQVQGDQSKNGIYTCIQIRAFSGVLPSIRRPLPLF